MATGIPVSVGELIDTATINTWARGYLRKNTGRAVNTSTTATDLLNSEFLIPGGAMSTDKIVRLTAWGNWLQNTGGARDFPKWQVFLGGTKLIDTNNSGGNNSLNGADRLGWRFVCEIQNLGATNAQQAFLTGILCTEAPGGVAQWAFATGNGMASADGIAYVTYSGGAVSGNDFTAVDTTVDHNLAFKVVNGFNSANYETKLLGALCEII